MVSPLEPIANPAGKVRAGQQQGYARTGDGGFASKLLQEMDVLNTGAPVLSVSDRLNAVSRLPEVQRVLLLCRSWILRYRLQTGVQVSALISRCLAITEPMRENGIRRLIDLVAWLIRKQK
jgi:hypothetical protein